MLPSKANLFPGLYSKRVLLDNLVDTRACSCQNQDKNTCCGLFKLSKFIWTASWREILIWLPVELLYGLLSVTFGLDSCPFLFFLFSLSLPLMTCGSYKMLQYNSRNVQTNNTLQKKAIVLNNNWIFFELYCPKMHQNLIPSPTSLESCYYFNWKKQR